MSVMTMIVIGLVMGLVFGVALEKSRVFEPGMIVGQFQLSTFIMLKMFLTASATGMVALAGLTGFGLVELHPKAAIYAATAVGGFLTGAGMAIAGACPGTALAQVGAGYKDSIAVVVGGILGAMAYGYFEPALAPLFDGGDGKITWADTTGLPFWLLALCVAAAIVVVLFALERWRPWRTELGDNYNGLGTGRESTPPSGSAVPAE